MNSDLQESPHELQPYGLASNGARVAQRPPLLVASLAIGGTLIVAGLPMTALNAFGWGFMVGDWRFTLSASAVAGSIVLIPAAFACPLLRAKWITGATLWLAAANLLLSVLSWAAGIVSLGTFWHGLNLIGTAMVLMGAAVQRSLLNREVVVSPDSAPTA